MTDLEKEMKDILMHSKKSTNFNPDRIEVVFTAWGFLYQLKSTAPNTALHPEGFRYSGELTKEEEDALTGIPYDFVYYDLNEEDT